ncbi:MAG: rod shape-determining protein MreC [Patescibacteria group bacterium]
MVSFKRSKKTPNILRKISVLLVIAILLIILSIKVPGLSNITSGVFIPIKSDIFSFSSNVGGFFYNINNINNIESRNTNLERRVYNYKSELANLNIYKSENKILKEQLNKKYFDTIYRYTLSKILYYGPINTLGYIYVGSGSNQGVKVGDAVVYKNFLLGKVVYTYSNYSKVILISNVNLSIPVIVNHVNAILTGSLSSSLILQDVTQLDSVKVGDSVITSGIDGTFPQNLITGYVSYVSNNKSSTFKTINVDNAINIYNLQYVFIINNK